MDAMLAAPESPSLQQQGFVRGFSVGLLTCAVPCALWGVYRALVEIPAYENIFRQVKVPMPGLTLLALKMNGVMAALLLTGGIACGVAIRFAGSPKTILRLNLTFLLVAVGWLALVTLAVQGPMISLLEGIGGRR